MKRILSLFVMLLAVCVLSAALADPVIIPSERIPEEGLSFSREQALEKAAELLTDHGYAWDAKKYHGKATAVRLPDGRSAWVILMEEILFEMNVPSHDLYALLSADDGEVIELSFPEDCDAYTWILLRWIEAKNQYKTLWSIDDQVLFDSLFSPDSFSFDPSRAAVSADEAVRIASEWLEQNAGVGYDSTTLSYLGMYDESSSWYCWSVSFYDSNEQVYIVLVNSDTGEVEDTFDLAEGQG